MIGVRWLYLVLYVINISINPLIKELIMAYKDLIKKQKAILARDGLEGWLSAELCV